MKLKHLLIGFSCFFVVVFSLLLFITILSSDEQDGGFGNSQFGGATVSMEVLAHKPTVEKYAKEYGVVKSDSQDQPAKAVATSL